MNSHPDKIFSLLGVALVAVVLFVAGSLAAPEAETHSEDPSTTATRVIVQGDSIEEVAAAVLGVGGTVTHDLGIIKAVAASVTPEQRRLLAAAPEVGRIHTDRQAKVAGSPQPDTVYPTQVGAAKLHAQGLTGRGVTVAVLDTGAWYTYYLHRNASKGQRMLANYDAVGDRVIQGSNDGSGHGTHVSSVIVSSGKTRKGKLYNGVAPNADLVVVRAFDANGAGSYADVIRGIEWVVANRDSYGIRVLNLSFSAPAQSHYWDDPLNQAVMAAWQAGIVVVASAGNGGPDPMTIGVPGNVPYVITVGAVSDAATLKNEKDDFLTSFSAAGPTVEGFVKPEIVAPGGHVRGIMESDQQLANDHPEFYESSNTFVMSGTSQAAAVVSGVAALMLEADPGLTPDELKCRLMTTARPAINDQGGLAYSVFQQGAGMVNAYYAAYDQSSGCANVGLDLARDLAGTEHYGGRADRDESGAYFLRDLQGDGFMWSDGYMWSDGFAWSDSFVWNDGFAWSDAFMWSDGAIWNELAATTNGFAWSDAFMWSDSFVWNDSFVWSDTTTLSMSINAWVPQE